MWTDCLSEILPSGNSNHGDVAISYDAKGLRDRATLTEGGYWEYGTDSRGQVVSSGKKWGNGINVSGQQYGYGYDGIGNRTGATVNERPATYAPNALNQYVSRTVPGYVDVLGEVLAGSTVTVNSLTPTRENGDAYFRQELELADLSPSQPNTANPVYLTTTVTATNGANVSTTAGKIFVPKTPEEFSYDPDGNLLSDGRWTYRWDGENRLKSIETQSAAVGAGAPKQRLSFVYDAQSRRISKKVETWNGSAWVEHHTFLYLYDGWNLAAEIYKQTGMALRSYVWGSDLSGGQAAGGVGGLLFIRQSPENKSFSVGYDGNGNVTALHDMVDASLAARYEYGPFGEAIRASGYYAKINPIRWSTKYQDAESDLVYYGYRYYSPGLGRWINRDPIEEAGGLNVYGFVDNDPTGQIDLTGLRGNGNAAGGNDLSKIRDKYNQMIRKARSRGWNVAADNLQHYIDGSGATKTIPWTWLRSFNEVIEAEKRNQKRFIEKTLVSWARSAKNGDQKLDYWDASEKGRGELYYASGTFTVTSYGNFIYNCGTVTGTADHYWWDPYDWHAGLSAYVPGFGLVNDADALKLQNAGQAKDFLMESIWGQVFSAKYNSKTHELEKIKWTSPTKGTMGAKSAVIQKYPNAVRPNK